jgi:nickel transport protein
MKKYLYVFTLLGFFLGVNSLLYAHKVNIFYYAENNQMYLETYFSDGTKCRNSEILIYDNNLDKLLLKGKTDLKGKFNFKIPKLPKNHNLKIVLDAEMGHRTEVIIKPSQWMESDEKNNSSNITTETQAKQSQSNPNNTAVQTQCDYKKIGKMLDKKLKPVLRELALLRNNKPSFNEIFGGIGYIFGIFGIILYFKAKND